MTLRDLFFGIKYELIQGNMDNEIMGISVHSKKAKQKDLFFCIAGTKVNGASFLSEVQRADVSAIVTEQDLEAFSNTTVIKVQNIRKTMAKISCMFYGNPSRKLTMIGITGTKGKTTTAFMLYHLLKTAGITTGLIGTVGVFDSFGEHPTSNTTPESCDLQKILADMVLQGITTVVMEVSSQGVMMERVYGIEFDYGIFTNMSEDHIGKGEHKSFEEYKYFKKQLMKQSKCSIINVDDACSLEMIEASRRVVTYGCLERADYQALDVSLLAKDSLLGVSFCLCDNRQNKKQNIVVGMPGFYSMYNALAAIAACESIGIGDEKVYKCLLQFCVRGRMEFVAVSDAFSLYIDYAHNQASLEQVLLSVKAYPHNRILLVFGCGGNRFKQKRSLMGKVACRLADMTILTNDNPRDENPESIIQDIVYGFDGKANYLMIQERKEAIRYAITHAKQNDIVILAGKGHETYQEICGIKYEMDERVLIREIMEEENARTICGYNHRYFD